MAEPENSLFAIDLDVAVDADAYASTAAEDNPAAPAVSRTHQSEADFAAIKASYTARQDGGGDLWGELVRAVPALAARDEQQGGAVGEGAGGEGDAGGKGEVVGGGEVGDNSEKVKLDKREQMLLGYAVGELYYYGEFGRVVEVCERVLGRVEVDGRVRVALERWRERARGRMEGEGGAGTEAK